MKNKKMLLKLGLFAMFVGCFGISFTSATIFKLKVDNIKSINNLYPKENIIPIHFADNGNDFGGFLYFSNGLIEEDTGEGSEESTDATEFYTVEIEKNNPTETEIYECERQIKGFYYNAERGERLRPLDAEMWSNNGVETTGGFYTLCHREGYIDALSGCLSEATSNGGEVGTGYDECKEKARGDFATDGNGYYGYIGHTYSGQNMGVIVGVDYNPDTKFISMAENGGFSPSFIRVANKYPVGFVYDYNGGVGLAGCKIQQLGSGMKTIVSGYKLNHDLNVFFFESGGNLDYRGEDGTVNCSDAVWDPLIGVVIEGIVGMGEMGNKNRFEVIGNQKNQKMQYFSSAGINNNTIFNYARKKAELLCRGKWKNSSESININSSDSIICINGNGNTINENNIPKNKTVIVKNGNVKIDPFNAVDELQYYDIFIDSGNLLINENENTQQFVFNNNGFISDTSTGSFEDNVNNATNGYTGDDVSVASFIRGNFIINGRIKSAREGSGLVNKYFIHGKISTRDDFDTLLETFKWRCNYGKATNETKCPLSSSSLGWTNPYDYASLVVIDQNLSSPFFNN